MKEDWIELYNGDWMEQMAKKTFDEAWIDILKDFRKIIRKDKIMTIYDEKIAFIVIGVLGIKLVLSSFFPQLTTELVDLLFSLLTLVAFATPVVISKLKSK